MIRVRDITEAKAIDLFTSLFGNDIETRYEKFAEETKELHEAMNNYTFIKSPEALKHLLDEFSDVQGTFTHLASLFSLYQQEMLHNCIDKVTGRIIDPNYKRFINIASTIDFSSNDNHPVAILVQEGIWVKPDPEFYYDEKHIEEAWQNHFKGNPTKMVKCNERGIQTGNDNEHE